ncbi:MAG TPA: dihydroorotase family protein [Acidimicrobiia bacterium]
MTFDVAVRGATVISASERRNATVCIADGRVASVVEDDGADIDAVTVVDGTGLWLLPGMVDTHVHLMDPGPTDREDFPTGTRAAAARGVTTIVEHTHARPVRSAAELTEKRLHLAGRANVDYGLAAHVWPDDIERLADTWRAGVAFFKIFTCTTHGVPALDAARLRGAFDAIARFGGATLVHCEDEELTASAERALRAAGRDDFGIVIEWRNRQAEAVAVAVAAALALETGVRATIAHVSSPEIVSIIGAARAAGADVAAEACPQYLVLREAEVLTEGPMRKFTPPARARSDDEEEAMWGALRRGDLTHVSTDHAPSTRRQKLAGSIWEAPFGLPGLDTTLPILLDAAIRGRIPPEVIVRAYAEMPARRYGLHPRKGSLMEGADGDFVLVDPAGSWIVTDAEVLSKAGWSPYSGRALGGAHVATYLRGVMVAENGAPLDERTGRFLPGPGAR